jgi:hypothetical protein
MSRTLPVGRRTARPGIPVIGAGTSTLLRVILAEFEVRHSRPIAPTRRLAIGRLYLPTDPAPGFGGLLLAGLVGGFVSQLEDETRDRLDLLLDDVERGRRIVQPRIRYRFQSDTVGLDRSRHRLVGDGEQLSLDLDDHANGLPQILAAVYAAGRLGHAARPAVFRLLKRASRWQGSADERLMAYLTDETSRSLGRGEGWALAVLGFTPGKEPSRSDINRRFRRLVREAHPDHGGSAERAGARIVDLSEAKRILMSVGA